MAGRRHASRGQREQSRLSSEQTRTMPFNPQNVIHERLLEMLLRVEPSLCRGVEYRPCLVTLNSGEILDRVLFLEEAHGLLGKKDVDIDTVREIVESPFRLPATLTTKMYSAGESGNGYHIFTLVMSDSRRLHFVMDSYIDFPRLPQAYSFTDIVELLPHEGREQVLTQPGLRSPHTYTADYRWCPYAMPPKSEKCGRKHFQSSE